MIIAEHTTAVLTQDLPAHGLRAGDTGVVVQINLDPEKPAEALSYLLEIFAVDGSTIDVIDAPAEAVRPGSAREVYHARTVAAE